MTKLKIDTIVFTNNAADETLELSGVVDVATYNATTGTINPITKDITTTGVISGAAYKTSGNVTVISGSGDIRPYGLFSFPTSTATSGYVLQTDADGFTSWVYYEAPTVLNPVTTAFYIAISKC